jgi:ribosomal protein S6
MNNYDLSVFFNTSGGEDSAKDLLGKLEGHITSTNGKIYKSEFIGKIDLATTFQKHTQAYSARIKYSGSTETLNALHKEFKINESIIRQLNARLEHVLSKSKVEELIG